MSVSKRLRFEILRRDGFRCRYCGSTPDQRELRVDHVIPAALGGRDEPTNLVTACEPCNSGKSSIAPGQPLVDDVAEDALRWARAMEAATSERRQDQERLEDDVEQFDLVWCGWTMSNGQPCPREAGWRPSIERFLLAGLSVTDLDRLTREAMECSVVPNGKRFRSLCRRAWDEITARQERAHEILRGA